MFEIIILFKPIIHNSDGAVNGLFTKCNHKLYEPFLFLVPQL